MLSPFAFTSANVYRTIWYGARDALGESVKAKIRFPLKKVFCLLHIFYCTTIEKLRDNYEILKPSFGFYKPRFGFYRPSFGLYKPILGLEKSLHTK